MIESGFWVAILVLVATFLLPAFSSELRKSQYILSGYWFVIILHQIAAFTNRYFLLMPGAGMDSIGIHRTAERMFKFDEWDFQLGVQFYIEMLGVVYRQFGVSQLLGAELSILAFAVSCIFLIKIMNQLGIIQHQLFALLLFGALPSMVMMGSITLREPYQILFFMLTIYFGIKAHLKGGINSNLIGLIVSAVMVGLLHKILIIYSGLLVALILIWPFRSVARRWSVTKIRLLALVIIPTIVIGIMTLASFKESFNIDLNLDTMEAVVSQNWVVAIKDFRSHHNVARSTYGIDLENHSFAALVYSFFSIYLHYLFGPFFWQVGGNPLDIYAAIESVLRLVLILFAVKQWSSAHGFQRQALGLLLVVYLSITLMWSMGTISYGTAMRHHLLSWWILAIAGVPPLIEKLTRIYYRTGVKA